VSIDAVAGRTRCLILGVIVQIAAQASGAVAAPTRDLDGQVAQRAARAADELRAALKALHRSPPPHDTQERARAAMTVIDRAVDTYFHAANLRDPAARPSAHALRRVVHDLLGGADPLLVMRADVIRFRPFVHRALADAARRSGARAEEVEHLREAMAVEGPTPRDLSAVRAACLTLGRAGEAEAAAAEIAALRTAALPGASTGVE